MTRNERLEKRLQSNDPYYPILITIRDDEEHGCRGTFEHMEQDDMDLPIIYGETPAMVRRNLLVVIDDYPQLQERIIGLHREHSSIGIEFIDCTGGEYGI